MDGDGREQIEMHQIVRRADAAAFEKHCCSFGSGKAVPLKLYRGALFSWMFEGLISPTPRGYSVENYLALEAMCFSYSPTCHHDNLTLAEHGVLLGLELVVFPPNAGIQKDFVNDPVREEIFEHERWLRHVRRVEEYNAPSNA